LNPNIHLSEITTPSLEAVGPDGDGPLDLVGLENLEYFWQRVDVHHLAHHVVVVVVVVAEVATQAVDVLLPASVLVAEFAEVLQDSGK